MNNPKRITIALCSLAALLGALNAWSSGHAIREGALAYVDLADAFRRGDWQAAVNGQWSPFYPWLASLVMRALDVNAYWEFAAMHLTDFLVYLGGLACFHFFLNQLVRYHQFRSTAWREQGQATFPEGCWRTLGYTLFIWSSLGMILRWPAGIPDMCVAAAIYLAAGLLLRIGMDLAGPAQYLLLGAVLGLGYLAKAAMFPMAFVFLFTAWLGAGPSRRATPRVLLALVSFFAVAAPFAVALSGKLGRPTFSESGKLAYVWLVNKVTFFTHWQGEPPGDGTPVHPTRRISQEPAVYEFASPIEATHPPKYDPTYWYEGVRLRFDPAKQFQALMHNSKIYFNLFLRQGGLIVGLITLCVLSSRRMHCLQDIAGEWILLLPAMAGLTMYWFVYVEWRYIAAFLVLLWLGAFGAVRLPASVETNRLASALTLALVTFMLAEISGLTIHEFYYRARSLARHPQWEIAQGLRDLGLQPGAKVGWFQASPEPLWARVGRLRVVAEMPSDQEHYFWAGNDQLKARVLDAFATAGAAAIVAERVPSYASDAGWRKVGHTGYYLYLLPGRSGGP